MAQFDVYRLANRRGLVLDCQTRLLDHIDSRFVVPLMTREEAPPPAGRLNPVFEVAETEYVMVTQAASSIRRRDLGPVVGSLANRDHEIMNALDFLLTGV